jgi:DHA1 family inner membrane transport protein
MACSGLLGGIVLLYVDRHLLSLFGAGALAIALLFAEIAHATIVRRALQEFGSESLANDI